MRFAHVVPAESGGPRLALIEDDEAILVEQLFDGAPRKENAINPEVFG